MANPWATVRLSSVLSLSSCSSGDKRNLIPPDPPDPQAQLSQVQYPRLSPSLPSSNRSKVSVPSTDSASSLSSSPTGKSALLLVLSQLMLLLVVLILKWNCQTNRASSPSLPNLNPILPLPSSATTSSPELEAPSQTLVLSDSIPSSSSPPPAVNPTTSLPKPTLVEKSEDLRISLFKDLLM
ncbi:hypothetical protein DY000_02043039 [Brassica cretica]|uniref:REJ domain-containing protein n=1 Tax=Brassica cretica TaxID=69181 RepID=A0ABQ7B964_BRACR|nr:hypothetical protein DY000_02043039 [Brassica cretica]